MNILMMTNTYKPIVGGLEKSVEVFSDEYRKRGHKVLIVAPEFEDAPEKEKGVFRVPAIQNFNGTDFSVELPIPTDLSEMLETFKPDLVHTHHPFLIGDTALRVSSEFNIPIVFTNHTLYEENTHYVPGDSKAMKRFVVKLSTGYANLCNQVIAPSESVADLIKKRGVKTPVSVVPTGIYLEKFGKGDGKTFRKFFDIPLSAFLIGIVGRVAPEKNVKFLSKAAIDFLKREKKAYFLVVGNGPSLDDIKNEFKKNELADRLVCTGTLQKKQLISAYHALDVFAFASHSETQGLVLVEAMSAGTPVVAVDAPGVREVVRDKKNGRLIAKDNLKDFSDALHWMATQSDSKKESFQKEARKTAEEFSVEKCVEKMLDIYFKVRKTAKKSRKNDHNNLWGKSMRMLKTQTDLIFNFSKATGAAVGIMED